MSDSISQILLEFNTLYINTISSLLSPEETITQPRVEEERKSQISQISLKDFETSRINELFSQIFNLLTHCEQVTNIDKYFYWISYLRKVYLPDYIESVLEIPDSIDILFNIKKNIGIFSHVENILNMINSVFIPTTSDPLNILPPPIIVLCYESIDTISDVKIFLSEKLFFLITEWRKSISMNNGFNMNDISRIFHPISNKFQKIQILDSDIVSTHSNGLAYEAEIIINILNTNSIYGSNDLKLTCQDLLIELSEIKSTTSNSKLNLDLSLVLNRGIYKYNFIVDFLKENTMEHHLKVIYSFLNDIETLHGEICTRDRYLDKTGINKEVGQVNAYNDNAHVDNKHDILVDKIMTYQSTLSESLTFIFFLLINQEELDIFMDFIMGIQNVPSRTCQGNSESNENTLNGSSHGVNEETNEQTTSICRDKTSEKLDDNIDKANSQIDIASDKIVSDLDNESNSAEVFNHAEVLNIISISYEFESQMTKLHESLVHIESIIQDYLTNIFMICEQFKHSMDIPEPLYNFIEKLNLSTSNIEEFVHQISSHLLSNNLKITLNKLVNILLKIAEDFTQILYNFFDLNFSKILLTKSENINLNDNRVPTNIFSLFNGQIMSIKYSMDRKFCIREFLVYIYRLVEEYHKITIPISINLIENILSQSFLTIDEIINNNIDELSQDLSNFWKNDRSKEEVIDNILNPNKLKFTLFNNSSLYKISDLLYIDLTRFLNKDWLYLFLSKIYISFGKNNANFLQSISREMTIYKNIFSLILLSKGVDYHEYRSEYDKFISMMKNGNLSINLDQPANSLNFQIFFPKELIISHDSMNLFLSKCEDFIYINSILQNKIDISSNIYDGDIEIMRELKEIDVNLTSILDFTRFCLHYVVPLSLNHICGKLIDYFHFQFDELIVSGESAFFNLITLSCVDMFNHIFYNVGDDESDVTFKIQDFHKKFIKLANVYCLLYHKSFSLFEEGIMHIENALMRSLSTYSTINRVLSGDFDRTKINDNGIHNDDLNHSISHTIYDVFNFTFIKCFSIVDFHLKLPFIILNSLEEMMDDSVFDLISKVTNIKLFKELIKIKTGGINYGFHNNYGDDDTVVEDRDSGNETVSEVGRNKDPIGGNETQSEAGHNMDRAGGNYTDGPHIINSLETKGDSQANTNILLDYINSPIENPNLLKFSTIIYSLYKLNSNENSISLFYEILTMIDIIDHLYECHNFFQNSHFTKDEHFTPSEKLLSTNSHILNDIYTIYNHLHMKVIDEHVFEKNREIISKYFTNNLILFDWILNTSEFHSFIINFSSNLSQLYTLLTKTLHVFNSNFFRDKYYIEFEEILKLTNWLFYNLKSCNIYNLFKIQNLLIKMNKLSEMVEDISTKSFQFFEKKRDLFPKYYFISDVDLSKFCSLYTNGDREEILSTFNSFCQLIYSNDLYVKWNLSDEIYLTSRDELCKYKIRYFSKIIINYSKMSEYVDLCQYVLEMLYFDFLYLNVYEGIHNGYYIVMSGMEKYSENGMKKASDNGMKKASDNRIKNLSVSNSHDPNETIYNLLMNDDLQMIFQNIFYLLRCASSIQSYSINYSELINRFTTSNTKNHEATTNTTPKQTTTGNSTNKATTNTTHEQTTTGNSTHKANEIKYTNIISELLFLRDESSLNNRAFDLTSNHCKFFHFSMFSHINRDKFDFAFPTNTSDEISILFNTVKIIFAPFGVEDCHPHFQVNLTYFGIYNFLSHSPLTEKVFIHYAMTILSNNRLIGSNVVGPAGTGKSESVKYFAKIFSGKSAFVINCGSHFDYSHFYNIFQGIFKLKNPPAISLDEFNRLTPSVLSSVCTLLTSDNRVSQKILYENTGQNIYENTGQNMDENTGQNIYENTGQITNHNKPYIFITINPFYHGRREIPENVSRLFRPIVMSSPDVYILSELICLTRGLSIHNYILKFSNLLLDSTKFENFCNCTNMTDNFVLLSQLCPEIGTLRFIKRVIDYTVIQYKLLGCEVEAYKFTINVIIGSKLRVNNCCSKWFEICLIQSTTGDCVTLENESKMMTCRPSSCPNITDIEDNMCSDNRVDMSCENRVDISSENSPHTFSISSLILHNLKVFNGVIINLNHIERDLLDIENLSFLNRDKNHRENILSFSLNSSMDIFGHFRNNGEWVDGVLMAKLRQNTESYNVFIFDGYIDPEWIENFNSVFDDNKIFSLVSGENFYVDPENIKFIFIVRDSSFLKRINPSSVSRLGIVCVNKSLDVVSNIENALIDHNLDAIDISEHGLDKNSISPVKENILKDIVHFEKDSTEYPNKSNTKLKAHTQLKISLDNINVDCDKSGLNLYIESNIDKIYLDSTKCRFEVLWSLFLKIGIFSYSMSDGVLRYTPTSSLILQNLKLNVLHIIYDFFDFITRYEYFYIPVSYWSHLSQIIYKGEVNHDNLIIYTELSDLFKNSQIFAEDYFTKRPVYLCFLKHFDFKIILQCLEDHSFKSFKFLIFEKEQSCCKDSLLSQNDVNTTNKKDILTRYGDSQNVAIDNQTSCELVTIDFGILSSTAQYVQKVWNIINKVILHQDYQYHFNCQNEISMNILQSFILNPKIRLFSIPNDTSINHVNGCFYNIQQEDEHNTKTNSIYTSFQDTYDKYIFDRHERIERGRSILSKISQSISHHSQLLLEKTNQLDEQKKKTQTYMEEIASHQTFLIKENCRLSEVSGELEKDKAIMEANREKVEADLSLAIPNVKRAISSIANLQKSHLDELKSHLSPPLLVKVSVEATILITCVMLILNDLEDESEIPQSLEEDDTVSIISDKTNLTSSPSHPRKSPKKVNLSQSVITTESARKLLIKFLKSSKGKKDDLCFNWESETRKILRDTNFIPSLLRSVSVFNSTEPDDSSTDMENTISFLTANISPQLSNMITRIHEYYILSSDIWDISKISRSSIAAGSLSEFVSSCLYFFKSARSVSPLQNELKEMRIKVDKLTDNLTDISREIEEHQVNMTIAEESYSKNLITMNEISKEKDDMSRHLEGCRRVLSDLSIEAASWETEYDALLGRNGGIVSTLETPNVICSEMDCNKTITSSTNEVETVNNSVEKATKIPTFNYKHRKTQRSPSKTNSQPPAKSETDQSIHKQVDIEIQRPTAQQVDIKGSEDSPMKSENVEPQQSAQEQVDIETQQPTAQQVDIKGSVDSSMKSENVETQQSTQEQVDIETQQPTAQQVDIKGSVGSSMKSENVETQQSTQEQVDIKGSVVSSMKPENISSTQSVDLLKTTINNLFDDNSKHWLNLMSSSNLYKSYIPSMPINLITIFNDINTFYHCYKDNDVLSKLTSHSRYIKSIVSWFSEMKRQKLFNFQTYSFAGVIYDPSGQVGISLEESKLFNEFFNYTHYTTMDLIDAIIISYFYTESDDDIIQIIINHYSFSTILDKVHEYTNIHKFTQFLSTSTSIDDLCHRFPVVWLNGEAVVIDKHRLVNLIKKRSLKRHRHIVILFLSDCEYYPNSIIDKSCDNNDNNITRLTNIMTNITNDLKTTHKKTLTDLIYIYPNTFNSFNSVEYELIKDEILSIYFPKIFNYILKKEELKYSMEQESLELSNRLLETLSSIEFEDENIDKVLSSIQTSINLKKKNMSSITLKYHRGNEEFTSEEIMNNLTHVEETSLVLLELYHFYAENWPHHSKKLLSFKSFVTYWIPVLVYSIENNKIERSELIERFYSLLHVKFYHRENREIIIFFKVFEGHYGQMNKQELILKNYQITSNRSVNILSIFESFENIAKFKEILLPKNQCIYQLSDDVLFFNYSMGTCDIETKICNDLVKNCTLKNIVILSLTNAHLISTSSFYIKIKKLADKYHIVTIWHYPKIEDVNLSIIHIDDSFIFGQIDQSSEMKNKLYSSVLEGLLEFKCYSFRNNLTPLFYRVFLLNITLEIASLYLNKFLFFKPICLTDVNDIVNITRANNEHDCFNIICNILFKHQVEYVGLKEYNESVMEEYNGILKGVLERSDLIVKLQREIEKNEKLQREIEKNVQGEIENGDDVLVKSIIDMIGVIICGDKDYVETEYLSICRQREIEIETVVSEKLKIIGQKFG